MLTKLGNPLCDCYRGAFRHKTTWDGELHSHKETLGTRVWVDDRLLRLEKVYNSGNANDLDGSLRIYNDAGQPSWLAEQQSVPKKGWPDLNIFFNETGTQVLRH